MDIFLLVLQQMLMMFLLVALGFGLKKSGLIPDHAGKTLSTLETYIFVPALMFNTELSKCTIENFSRYGNTILYGLICVIIGLAIAYPLSYVFIKKSGNKSDDYTRNIYKYALAFGNFGYMGNFIVQGIWGEEGLFQYILFTFFLNVVVYSWGLFILIPKDQNKDGFWKSISKGLLTPPFIATVLGIVAGLCNLGRFVPGFLKDALSTSAACMGPCAMILAGIVIGGYPIRQLLTNKKIYVVSALRLIIIPVAIVSLLKLLGLSSDITVFALIAFSAPLGLNTIVFPAAYGGETKTGASMAMISTVFSVATIPLLYLLLNVLWK